ncbi:MAG: homoaconitate hydratase [Fibrobacterota bacterium]
MITSQEFINPFSSKKELPVPVILDTTLRDGEQSPGIYFSNDEKTMIAESLDELGVQIIEAAIPGMGEDEKKVLRSLSRRHLKAEILAWNRLLIDDIKNSIDADVLHVHVSIPTSADLLKSKMSKEQSWVFKQMETVIDFAIREGLVVSFGAEDASRTELSFLIDVFLHAQSLGVRRVRYADTLGILTPDKTTTIIKTLSKKISIPLDFHAHNDFGLATANALCAWKAGARVLSSSLLGLGERAGNTSLEEFIGALHFLERKYGNFDFVKLRELCRKVSAICKRPIGSHKPIFGDEIFKHESGIHVDGLLKDHTTYEFYPPESVGGHRELVIGKHSGRAALKYAALQLNKTISDCQAQYFLMNLRSEMAEGKCVDPMNELKRFLEKNGTPLENVIPFQNQQKSVFKVSLGK